jgi:ferritin
MLTKKVEKILNEQVEKEGYSSHLYLAMASWAENSGFKGIADWLYAQAEEERLHMLKLVHYINERDGKAVIPLIKVPPAKFAGISKLFDKVLEHEQYITASINTIVDVCVEQKDFTTHNFIQWFVSEQIQEEANAKEIIDKLKLVGTQNMYLFDRDIMSLRTPDANAPAAV